MVMYDNEYKIKENINWTKDKIEPQLTAVFGSNNLMELSLHITF